MQKFKQVSQIKQALEYFEIKSEAFWKKPMSKAKDYLIKSLECHAFLNDWEKVVDISSKAVFRMNSFQKRSEFYYMWMTGLLELSDINGLKCLSEHIKNFYKGEEEAIALSEITKHFISGFQNINHLGTQNLSEKKTLTGELKSYMFIYAKPLKDKKQGLSLFNGISFIAPMNYFRVRNFLRAYSDNDFTKQMSELYNYMSRTFHFHQNLISHQHSFLLKRKIGKALLNYFFNWQAIIQKKNLTRI
jgi:hypothetical protein